jgi:hypothetical protein
LTVSVVTSRLPAAAPFVVTALLPIMAAVFIAYLVIGLAMPVLALVATGPGCCTSYRSVSSAHQ